MKKAEDESAGNDIDNEKLVIEAGWFLNTLKARFCFNFTINLCWFFFVLIVC